MTAAYRVVHLITLLEFGGAQGNTIYSVKNTDPKKFDCYLWAGKGAYWDADVQKDLPAGKLKYFPTLVRQVHPLYDFLTLIKLTHELRKFKPTILHTHSSKAGILGRLAGRLAGVPVIIHTFHGFGFNDQQKPWVKALFVGLERWMARYSNALIFVSQSNLDTAQKLGIGDPATYRIIRSGIPLQKIKSEAENTPIDKLKASLNIPIDAPVVISIGAFKPQKNLIDFIELARRLHKELPNAHFLLLGDGEQRPLLEKKIKEFGLADVVHLVGWRQDAYRLLRISNVFVMTSLWEGLPRALVEAMTLGLPSVCYKTDGVEDLLSCGGGIMVDQKEVAQMAGHVQRLLTDPAFAKKLSDESKAKIQSEFDIDQMVRQIESLYSSTIPN